MVVLYVIREEIVILMTVAIHIANVLRLQKEITVKFRNLVMSSVARIMANACQVVNAAVQMVGLDISVKLRRINFLYRVSMERVT